MLFAITTAATIIATLAAAVPATGPSAGIRYKSIVANIARDKCVDVAGANYADGTAIQLATCSGNNAQKFDMHGYNDHDYVTFHPLDAQHLCLDAGVNPGPGSLVHLWTCYDVPQQQWAAVTPGLGMLKLKGVDLCLDVKDGVTANGSPLQVWSCQPGYPFPNQAFKFNS
ncbi:uncharacterized protein EHS24_009386 [Apiotrichum porosum]|uniref:Ricin B lectin domain-containing protein n=1 Tax=Apiotrichum porosum TaxID=105984 RepID=A0A427XLS9_9TREE|nr:uncharacterized protein EHS24_009386 [Apiotrichum porosum]RSH79732.1 hypothetical protein EHS24_009386 [Apiotrichum porosum]